MSVPQQPIPTETSAALAEFKCTAYACTLSGVACARRWRSVNNESSGRVPLNQESCQGCQAGEARASLLVDYLGERRASSTRWGWGGPAKISAGTTTPPEPPPLAPESTNTSEDTNTSEEESDMEQSEQSTAGEAAEQISDRCARPGCDRSVDLFRSGPLSGICRSCAQVVRAKIRRGDLPDVDDEGLAWLMETPKGKPRAQAVKTKRAGARSKRSPASTQRRATATLAPAPPPPADDGDAVFWAAVEHVVTADQLGEIRQLVAYGRSLEARLKGAA